MKPFMTENFLLDTSQAKTLYAMGAGNMPIIDFHNHLSGKELYENRPYENLTQVWLGHDHYKWRFLRSCGVDEKYVTGDAGDKEKYDRWAETVSRAYGNPLYHWTHLELWRYFGIDEPLTVESKDRIWGRCCHMLKAMPPRTLVEGQNVKILCTTNDPAEDLKYHKLLSGWKVQVLPTFRPDRALNIQKEDFPNYIQNLMEAAGKASSEKKAPAIKDILDALECRLDDFVRLGCRLSDHSLEVGVFASCSHKEADAILSKRLKQGSVSVLEHVKYQTFMLLSLAGMFKKRKMTMQLHIGALRNISASGFLSLGADAGLDAVSDRAFASELAELLDAMEKGAGLPRTIIYPLNPGAWTMAAAMAPCFCRGKTMAAHVQMGAAWWFNDHEAGITRQLEEYACSASLENFVGMVTDSRSLLSFPRHEYFRRVLCRLLGRWMNTGKIPEDYKTSQKIVEAVCYKNAENMLKNEKQED